MKTHRCFVLRTQRGHKRTRDLQVGKSYEIWLGAPDLTTTVPANVDSYVSFSLADTLMGISTDGRVTGLKWYGSNPSAVRLQVLRQPLDCGTVGAGVNILRDAGYHYYFGWTYVGACAFGFTKRASGVKRVQYGRNNRPCGSILQALQETITTTTTATSSTVAHGSCVVAWVPHIDDSSSHESRRFRELCFPGSGHGYARRWLRALVEVVRRD